MSILMILVLASLAVVLVLTIAAVASSPPSEHQVLDRVQRGKPYKGKLRRATDRQPITAQEPPVAAAGFQ